MSPIPIISYLPSPFYFFLTFFIHFLIGGILDCWLLIWPSVKKIYFSSTDTKEIIIINIKVSITSFKILFWIFQRTCRILYKITIFNIMQNRYIQTAPLSFFSHYVSVHCKSLRAIQVEEVTFCPIQSCAVAGRTPCLISIEDLSLKLTWAIMKLLGKPIELTLVKTLCSFSGENLLKTAWTLLCGKCG